MTNRVLLVNAYEDIFKMVSQALGSSVELDWVRTFKEANHMVSEEEYQMLLLDVELPDGSGVDLCNQIQMTKPELPVFFLSTHDELSEKVLGFSAGADDYITKPFNILELKARIEAKLKKVEVLKRSTEYLRWKEIEINKNSQQVQILVDDHFEPIDLTALEFKLLTYFANHTGNVISRDKILDEIWGENIHVYSRSVDTHVSKLRKKLGPVAHLIESIHGAGYKFNPAHS